MPEGARKGVPFSLAEKGPGRPETGALWASGAKGQRRSERISPIINAFKVFEVLRNFFQKVSKWGLGQSPKVLTHKVLNWREYEKTNYMFDYAAGVFASLFVWMHRDSGGDERDGREDNGRQGYAGGTGWVIVCGTFY